MLPLFFSHQSLRTKKPLCQLQTATHLRHQGDPSSVTPPLSALYVFPLKRAHRGFASSHYTIGRLKQPGLVYLAFHSVGRSTKVSCTWICLPFPTQNPTTNTFLMKIKGKSHRKLRPHFTDVFYGWLSHFLCSGNQHMVFCKTGIFRIILWCFPKTDLHTLLTPVPLVTYHSHRKVSYQISLCRYTRFLLHCPHSGDKTAGYHLLY